jgi:hypothetical protein
MLLAWSVTEVIRYPFYVVSLLGKDIYALNWLRYTLFLVLYPLGAGSEAFLSFSTLPPLSTLPHAPSALASLHDVVHKLPAAVSQSLLRTTPGRNLLWSVARAKAAHKAKHVAWTGIQYARLVLFFVWWPGKLMGDVTSRVAQEEDEHEYGDGGVMLSCSRPSTMAMASTILIRVPTASLLIFFSLKGIVR